MPRKVLDWSFSRPNLHAVKAMGYEAAGRYLAPDNAATHGKIIFKPEYDAILAVGMGVFLVWEQTVSDASWNAPMANQQADALGFPKDRPIYYAVDTDVPVSEYARISAKLGSLPGRPKGIYAEHGLVQRCLSDGTAKYGWLTSATAWSRDAAPDAHLRQLVSNLVPGADENIILKDDYGQHPAPDSSTPPEDDDMPMTMVTPQDYPDGKPHKHKGEVWCVSGVSATWVSSPAMVGVYNYIGVGGPIPISAEWFDNLCLLPSEINPQNHSFDQLPGGGGGGGDGASPAEVAAAVLAGLTAHPLKPS